MRPPSKTAYMQASRVFRSSPLVTNAAVRNSASQCTRSLSWQSTNRNETTNHARRHNCTLEFPSSSSSLRTFSTSPLLLKKKEKEKKGSSAAAASSESEVDPFNFDEFQTEINGGIEALKSEISKLRSGGRFNTEALESLRVTPEKGSKETVQLADLAQVIPKGGRMVTLLVGEEDYVKPITSAIASSNLSLNPQPDPHNPIQLNVPIPPPTKESRDQAVKQAKSAMEKAANSVRNARGTQNKKLKGLGKDKRVRPDDLHKALEQMEKISEKGQKDVKEVFEAAKKAIEQV